MKKIILSLALITTSLIAKADVINCSFTEPFINSSYSMAQQSLTYKTPGDNGKDVVTVIKNVSFQIKGAGSFELVSKEGKVLQSLKISNNGSDGMSDIVFPYEVNDTGMHSNANNGIGGCYSNSLKAKLP